ncbi:MAG TPA: DUF1499 domain-containing protein [Trueperaceae bacterium]|nr:DUF1499 domain-containing protein [Trueperaceae bacterium]
MLKIFVSVAVLAFLNNVFAQQTVQPCPKSPNCVSSVDAIDDKHYLPAFTFEASVDITKATLKEIIAATPRSKLIEESENYLRFEFRSRVFRFVDSVEFYFDDENKLVQFSSRANLGYGDFGVNKRRMLELIQRFEQSQ